MGSVNIKNNYDEILKLKKKLNEKVKYLLGINFTYLAENDK